MAPGQSLGVNGGRVGACLGQGMVPDKKNAEYTVVLKGSKGRELLPAWR